ncbi:MAG: hypothetical protein HQL46_14585 [Gammaproteobacteria bacterium]|nr:hypothetical protein [Gammaproteobacteria bacterium]
MSRKLMFWFLLISIIPLYIAGIFIYQSNLDVLTKQSQSRLVSVVKLKNQYLSNMINNYLKDINYLVHNETTGIFLSELTNVYQGNKNNIRSFKWEMVYDKFSQHLLEFRNNRGYQDILLFDLSGTILFSANTNTELGREFFERLEPKSRFKQAFSKAIKTGHVIFTDFEINNQNQVNAYLLQIITDQLGDKVGLAAIPFPYKTLSKVLRDQLNMGKTQDTYLIGQDKIMRTQSRFSGHNAILKQLVDTQASQDWLKALTSKQTNENAKIKVYTDYRGVEVLGSWDTLIIADKSLAIINEIDWSEISEPITKMKESLITTGLISVGIVFIVVLIVAHSISGSLTHSVSDISSSSSQIDATMSQQASVSQSLTSSITEITSTINELDTTAKNNTKQAENIINETEQGKKLAEQGSIKIASTVEDMSKLKDEMTAITEQIDSLNVQIQEISNITYMVLELADQTRMLSLNAAVEAIRSGEHGAGFKVVAKEIRNLSDESKRSAKQIGQLLRDIQKSMTTTMTSTSNSVKTMNKSVDISSEISETFNSLAQTYIGTANDLEQIVQNIKQETLSIKQVYDAMVSIQQGQSENTRGFKQVQENIINLGNVAKRLKDMV